MCVHAQVEKRREGTLAHPYFLGFQWLATAWAEPGRVLLSKLEEHAQIKALQVPDMYIYIYVYICIYIHVVVSRGIQFIRSQGVIF